MSDDRKVFFNFYQKNKKAFGYAQMAALFIAIVGLILKLQGWTPSSQLIVAGLCTLSFLVCLKGVMSLQSKEYGEGLTNIGFGVLLIGMLFRLQHWPNSDEMFYVGGGLVVVGFIIPLVTNKKPGPGNNTEK